MFRYIHTFLRYIGFLIIPILIAPVVATAILLSTVSYTSTAALWVEQPLYVDQQQSTDGAIWDSPAKKMAGSLTELMGTRNFMSSIIDSSSSIKASVKTEEDRLALMDDISKKIKIDSSGWQLIKLSYTDKSAKPALDILNATVTNFKNYYDQRMAQQGEGATSYYEGLVKTSKAELDKANKDLQDFLNANPNKVGTDSSARAVTQEDIQYGTLVQNRDAARKRYDDAEASLEKTQNSYGAYLQGQGVTLKIQDPPQVFDANASKSRQIAIGVGIGLAIGGLIAAIITIILTKLDNKLRFVSRTQQVLKIGRVMELPNVLPVRGWQKQYRMLALKENESGSQKLLPAPSATVGTLPKSKRSSKPSFVLRRNLSGEIRNTQTN